MDDPTLALVKDVHRKEIERLDAARKLETPPPAPIPHTELPELPPDNPLHHEWNTYRREVAGLLAAGLESGWVVIKGDRFYGLFGSWKLAYIAGLEKVANKELQPPFLVQQIRAGESTTQLERLRKACPHSPLPLKKTA